MLIIDLSKKRIVDDEEVKNEIINRHPYKKWVEENLVKLDSLPDPEFIHKADSFTIKKRHRIFGYTKEDLLTVMRPMAVNGQEAIGSMGTDAALALLIGKTSAIVQIFQAAFCTGNKSTCRCDKRRTCNGVYNLYRTGTKSFG